MHKNLTLIKATFGLSKPEKVTAEDSSFRLVSEKVFLRVGAFTLT